MKITADLGRCEGYGNCLMAAPDFFDIGDDDRVDIHQGTIDPSRLPEVEEAIHNCPASALGLVP